MIRAQRSRVSWESTACAVVTARRMSVDFPLPGSPETTTTSPGAKRRPLGLRPDRSRRSRTTGACAPDAARSGAPGCAGIAPCATPAVVAYLCNVIALPLSDHPTYAPEV